MTVVTDELEAKAKAAKAASRQLAKLSTQIKNQSLLNIAEALKARQGEILAANEKDYKQGQQDSLSEVLLDRLDVAIGAALCEARLDVGDGAFCDARDVHVWRIGGGAVEFDV